MWGGNIWGVKQRTTTIELDALATLGTRHRGLSTLQKRQESSAPVLPFGTTKFVNIYKQASQDAADRLMLEFNSCIVWGNISSLDHFSKSLNAALLDKFRIKPRVFSWKPLTDVPNKMYFNFKCVSQQVPYWWHSVHWWCVNDDTLQGIDGSLKRKSTSLRQSRVICMKPHQHKQNLLLGQFRGRCSSESKMIKRKLNCAHHGLIHGHQQLWTIITSQPPQVGI